MLFWDVAQCYLCSLPMTSITVLVNHGTLIQFRGILHKKIKKECSWFNSLHYYYTRFSLKPAAFA